MTSSRTNCLIIVNPTRYSITVFTSLLRTTPTSYHVLAGQIMGRRNQCSIERDEILAEKVRKYPCLYDKSHAEYKDASRKKNAWAKIDEERNELPRTSSHKWEVLLSRYNCKRMKYNSLNVSGVEERQFLKPRKTWRNIGFFIGTLHLFNAKSPNQT